MPGRKHIHRYVKATLGRNKWPIYKCDLPDCSHYISAELVEGKFSICHRCGERFILTAALLKLANPHCLRCTERKVDPVVKSVVDRMFDDLNIEDLLAQDSESSVVISDTDEPNEVMNELDEMLFSTTTEKKHTRE